MAANEQIKGLTPTKTMRETGIPPRGDVPWGTRICIFYDTKQDLFDTAVPYFEAGVKSGEFCLWAIYDPITKEDAEHALRRALPDLDRRQATGQIEVLLGPKFYLPNGEFDLQPVIRWLHQKLSTALQQGFEGMRISGNAFSIETPHQEFLQYEQDVAQAIAGKHVIWLCTYGLEVPRSVDLPHQRTNVSRKHEWKLLKTSDDKLAPLEKGLDVLPHSIQEAECLTLRERMVLAEIVKGLSSKEIAARAGVSPRTVEFHRANLLRKIGAKNTAALVRKALSQ